MDQHFIKLFVGTSQIAESDELSIDLRGTAIQFLWVMSGHRNSILSDVQSMFLPRAFEKESPFLALNALEAIRIAPVDIFGQALMKGGREKAILTACGPEQNPSVRRAAIDVFAMVREGAPLSSLQQLHKPLCFRNAYRFGQHFMMRLQ